MTNEQWKDIKGTDEAYQISNFGRVKSVSRLVYNGHGNVMTKEKILKPNKIENGYQQVTLYINKRRVCKLVHRLLVEAFLPNPNPAIYDQINHIDGNKENNHISNLEWSNNSLNQLHAYRMGLNVHSERSGRPKVRVIATSWDKKEEIIFPSIADAERFIGEGKRTLASSLKCKKGRVIRNGYWFRYADRQYDKN